MSEGEEKPWLLWATLYTDASWCQDLGGAWAIWLRSEKGRIVQSGKCPPEIFDPTLAEFYAVLMGVQIASKAWAAQAVLINSDCMAVVQGLGSKYRWSSSKAVRRLQDKILRTGPLLRTKHVKAHTRGQDIRSYLNRQVDRLANQARKGQAQVPP